MTKLSMSEEEMLKRKYTRPYEKQIADLEKENAELKEKYVKNITDCDICDTYCNSQLTKAKELLKRCYENYIYLEPLRSEIEQFLKEVEGCSNSMHIK